MQLNFRPTAKILTLMLCLLALASCKGQQVQTLSPQEQAAARTKLAYQQQTQQVIQLKTQGLWTGELVGIGDQPPTSVFPAQSQSTQVSGILTPTNDQQNTQTQPAYPINGQATSILILPPTATVQPASTRTQTQAPATPTATRTRTSVPATATATQTQPAQSKWAGEWIIFFEQKDGSYLSGPINITITGTDLTATASLGGSQYSFEGTVYFQLTECASGTWTGQDSSGNFWWSLVSDNQFAGSRENRFGFCGARSNAVKPEPCKLLPFR